MTTAKSLSLTYGKPEASCNMVDMYLGKRSASLMIDETVLRFLQFGDDSIRNDYCGNYPIFEYWSYTLFIDL